MWRKNIDRLTLFLHVEIIGSSVSLRKVRRVYKYISLKMYMWPVEKIEGPKLCRKTCWKVLYRYFLRGLWSFNTFPPPAPWNGRINHNHTTRVRLRVCAAHPFPHFFHAFRGLGPLLLEHHGELLHVHQKVRFVHR